MFLNLRYKGTEFYEHMGPPVSECFDSSYKSGRTIWRKCDLKVAREFLRTIVFSSFRNDINCKYPSLGNDIINKYS